MLLEKSRTTSFFLTLLLGPLGLFYSSPMAAAIMILLAALTAATIIIPVALWLLSIAIGDHYTDRHNQGIRRFERLLRNNSSGEA